MISVFSVVGVCVGGICSIKYCVWLWRENLRRHKEKLLDSIDLLISSKNYRTNIWKQEQVLEVSRILEEFKHNDRAHNKKE